MEEFQWLRYGQYIAEGFGRRGNKEFSQFLSISLGSCLEVQSQSYRALDCKYITQAEFQKVYDGTRELYHRIAKFSDYLSSIEFKGVKYKEQN